MAEVQKPTTIPEPVVPETTPAAPVATGLPALDNTTPAATETKPEEVKPEIPEPASAAAATEEPKVDEAKPVEPITTGILGYKAPGLVKSLIFSKKHFWLGEDAVPVNSLSSYLRGEKGDVAHPTAAWSSQTGKGLLYFVKHAEDKKSPAGVLNLAEATDLSKDGTVEFSLKLHAHKHAFQAKTAADRDGWLLAVEKAVEEAKASAEGIKSSEGYKEALEKLNKPYGVVAGAATTKEATPKKSTDVKPAADADRASSSSSSSDEDKKEKKKSKSKSRSASRKRGSIFGGLIGKKDELKEKKEEHAEAKEVEKKNEVKPVEPESTVVAAQKDGTTDTPSVAPIAPVEPATTELATTAGVAPVAEPVAETTDAKPKPAKRGSVFGSFFEKVRSPTTEKKEAEVTPAVPPKDEEVVKDDTPAEVAPPAVAAAAPAPVITETAPVVETKPEETKPEDAKVDAPKANEAPKEKKDFSFGKFFGTIKDKSKSPVAEKSAPKEDTTKVDETAPKIEETPVAATAAPVAPVEPATEAKADVKADETKPEETVTPTDAKEKRRSSFFGNLTSSVKKDKKTSDTEATEGSKDEKHPSKLSGLFRNPSKAVKSKKEKDAVVAKPEETTEAKDDKVVAPAVEEPKVEEKPVEDAPPKVIGDVVPEAVTVGQAQPSTTPAVQASA